MLDSIVLGHSFLGCADNFSTSTLTIRELPNHLDLLLREKNANT